MVGVGCLAYRKAPGKQVILKRRMDLVCCFIVSFMFLKILSCNLHGGWTLPVEIPSFWGTGSCLFHNLWKSWYLMKAATPPPPPKSQAYHGDAASWKRWWKICKFLSFVAGKSLSPLPCGSWGEKQSCDEIVLKLWGNLGGACMTLDQLLCLSVLLFLDHERI